MITLTELTLKRFRNHLDRTFKFTTGITGIVGNNGQGKSSIFEAINFLFTGDAWDDRAKVISTGTNGSSYVKGSFILDGKAGTIERHLDTSKVILEYDGKKYNKAGDVKELWATLLQIDSHIFKHVIIAKQGQIAELFSGEDAVREKAFQKIFLVPNTERLRNIIWDSYIKLCPPPLPEEDEKELNKQLSELVAKLTPLKEKKELMTQSVLTETQYSSVINSIAYAKLRISDALLRPQLELDREKIITQLTNLRDARAIIENLVDLEKLEQLKKTLIQATTIASKLESIASLNASITATKAKLKYKTPGELKARAEEMQTKQKVLNATSNDAAILNAKLTAYKNELSSLSSLKSKAVCPTCKQEIKDVQVHIEELNTNIATLSTQLIKLQTEHRELQAKLNEITNDYNSQVQLVGSLTTSKENLASVSASLNGLDTNNLPKIDEVKAAINKLEEDKQLLGNCNFDILGTQNKLNLLEQKISQLTHASESDPTKELTMLEEVLQVNKQRVDRLNAVAAEISYIELNITMLNNRVAESKVNAAKNAKRMLYLNKLQSAYAILHTTEFPRKLIQTYSGTVEEELLLQLQQFVLPYSAKIGDNFKVITTNNDGNPIPTLSGGQGMIMGLCLRLALHSMFSSSFGFLCIDEGSTHLDTKNKELYFNAIVNLREKKTINQIFIIDHDSALTSAVDTVIEL